MLPLMPKIIAAIPFFLMLFIMLNKSNYAERIASIRDAALKHFFLFAGSCRVFQIVVSLGRGQGAFGSVFVFEI